MFAGPTRTRWRLPTRAVPLPDGHTAYSFTMFQTPGMPDELFEAQHQSLRREFANIEKRSGDARPDPDQRRDRTDARRANISGYLASQFGLVVG